MEHSKIVLPSLPQLEKVKNENFEILLPYRLRALRKAQGKTLKEMALIVGVTISTYAGYETPKPNANSRVPALEKIMKLSNYFGVSVDYLIGATDEKPRYQALDVTELAEKAELQPHVKATLDFAISEITKQKELQAAGV